MKIFLNLLLLVLLYSCAKPTVVDVVMSGDEKLNCEELKEGYKETRRFKQEAENAKQVDTGGNVTRTVLFWPALVKTIHNADIAIRAANDRAYHLVGIMKNKNCKEADKLYTELSKTDTIKISYEIQRLHKLYKRGALTEEEFTKAKQKVLDQ
tara:strand:+ start:2980 stop:3438 length:459 start_codon:yes stop_codon:yes gene_type:complete